MRQRRNKKDYHKQALADQIEDPESNGVRTRPRGEKKRKRAGEEEGDELLSAKISGRILKTAREQQEELEAEEAAEQLGAERNAGSLADALRRAAAGAAGGPARPGGLDSDDEDDEDEFDVELRARTQAALGAGPSGRAAGGGGKAAGGKAAEEGGVDAYTYEIDEEDISPEDERALAAFMAPAGGAGGAGAAKTLSLGDVVVAKLREKQREQGLEALPGDGEEGGEQAVPEDLDEKVVEVYRGVGKLLARYTVGSLPKAFKIIPNLRNWEEVLYLTDPDMWSEHACYAATKLFVSNLNARLAQRFLALVLLPRVRREIAEKQKLHFALFMALKKATYKPGAFYKGLLLPLCSTRSCTLREAVIFSSVLKRTSIPVLHSAAALLRMADMEYCGTTSFFMRVLLDKKYALPYRVVDALVDHFVRFADDERSMPVVWHQTLLCFIQRYKDEIRPDDKAALRKLCGVQSHYLVTPEVIRELDHSTKSRGTPGAAGPAAAGAGPAGRATGAAAMVAKSQVVIGKNVSENVASMPPVMIMEDD